MSFLILVAVITSLLIFFKSVALKRVNHRLSLVRGALMMIGLYVDTIDDTKEYIYMTDPLLKIVDDNKYPKTPDGKK